MRIATRDTRTFSLDRKILAEVKRTKGGLSESERVNRLLRRALDLERRAALDAEAASFFASVRGDQKERRAFEYAAVASWTRH